METHHEPARPPESRDHGIHQWLSLTDYASKYRVSVSTLRRRIKLNQISHRFQDGRYMLLDSTPSEIDSTAHQQPLLDSSMTSTTATEFLRGLGFEPKISSQPEAPSQPQMSSAAHDAALVDEPVISSATRLMSELKRAYMNILQEKEEQIIQLKEEVSDLKTLVRVLEDENERLSGHRIGY